MADPAMSEVMNLLKAEPSNARQALREQLAILVSTGKAKEAIGVQLTHEQVKLWDDQDVQRHYKRYEAYVGA